MKTTISKINEVLGVANKYSNEKFNYAKEKLAKQAQKKIAEFNESIEDKRIELCSVDEKGNILSDEKGNYHFTKENLISLNKFVRDLNNQEFEIEPYFCKIIPEGINDIDMEILEGYILEACTFKGTYPPITH